MARYAIGDIHGCVRTFTKLVEEKLNLTKQDTLFILGDLVNKGPDSRGVMDYVFRLVKENYNITCLRGNHDQMFLDAYYGKFAPYWSSEHAETKTLKSFGVTSVEQISIRYFDFINEMPFFIELDNCFLVHAGLNFNISNPLMDIKAMLHLRKVDLKPERIGGKRLIHGHVPCELETIEDSVRKNSKEINIDGGCVYYLNEGLGNLVAIDLDTMQLFKQANLDQPYPIDIKNHR
jgi:serine/threonine protein phosphatase 1